MINSCNAHILSPKIVKLLHSDNIISQIVINRKTKGNFNDLLTEIENIEFGINSFIFKIRNAYT